MAQNNANLTSDAELRQWLSSAQTFIACALAAGRPPWRVLDVLTHDISALYSGIPTEPLHVPNGGPTKWPRGGVPHRLRRSPSCVGS